MGLPDKQGPAFVDTRFTAAARFLIYGLLIFTPLARGSVQGWAIATIEVATLISLTLFLLGKCLAGGFEWIPTPLDKPFVVLVILTGLSVVFSLERRTSIWSAIFLLTCLIIFYLVIQTVRTRAHVRHLIYLLIGMAVFLSIFGLFKKFGANPFPWWDYGDLGYGSRLASTYGCPNHLAGYIEMTLPLLLGLFLLDFRPAIAFILGYLTLLLLVALMLSLSRGGWISAALGLAFMVGMLLKSRHFIRKRMLIAIVAGVVILAVIALVSTPVVERLQTAMERGRDPSFHSRVVVWGGVIKMIADHPLTGIGPGAFKTVFMQYQPPGMMAHFFMAHNDYFHFVSETGLLLVPVILWMMVVFYRRGLEKLKHPSRLVRATTLGALSGVTALLVHSIYDFNLHIPANAILFVVLAAIVAAPLPVHDIM